MSIYGLIVARNEASRYLFSILRELEQQVDGIAFYDNQSTDYTAGIAKNFGCEVAVRPDDVPSFMEHEGKFRQAAWHWMEKVFQPTDAWIVVLDCDEVLVARDSVRAALVQEATRAESQGVDRVAFPIREVFGWSDSGIPMIRTDGYWGSEKQPRFCRYQKDRTYSDKPMGCGSLPQSLQQPLEAAYIDLLHFGYTDFEDLRTKYSFYSERSDSGGHSSIHINSIIQQPVLDEWDGPFPTKRILRAS